MSNRYTQRYNIKTKRYEILDRLTQEGIGDYPNITQATHAAWSLNMQAQEKTRSER